MSKIKKVFKKLNRKLYVLPSLFLEPKDPNLRNALKIFTRHSRKLYDSSKNAFKKLPGYLKERAKDFATIVPAALSMTASFEGGSYIGSKLVGGNPQVYFYSFFDPKYYSPGGYGVLGVLEDGIKNTHLTTPVTGLIFLYTLGGIFAVLSRKKDYLKYFAAAHALYLPTAFTTGKFNSFPVANYSPLVGLVVPCLGLSGIILMYTFQDEIKQFGKFVYTSIHEKLKNNIKKILKEEKTSNSVFHYNK